jgi:hypothetical protein
MTMYAAAVWPVLTRLQERAQLLEDQAASLHHEAAALRADVRQVVQALDQPVASYVVDREEYVITAGDVAAVKAKLLKPHSEEAIYTVALADKISARQSQLPPEEQKRRFRENIEAIRGQAIADGTAIDDPMEAVVGD